MEGFYLLKRTDMWPVCDQYFSSIYLLKYNKVANFLVVTLKLIYPMIAP